MGKSTGKAGWAQSVARTALTLALTAGGSIVASGTALAQVDGGDGNEIIITAQKREQALQDVPIAVSAYTAEQLENSNIGDLNDLQRVSPSLFINTTGSAASDTTIRIRGVGTTGNNAGLEGAVGVFIDGVYRNRSGMALGQLVDVQRIEVLRGPQSVLFGKNTSAGALSVITRAPDVDAFAVGGTMNFGNPEILGANGYMNIPLSETFAIRGTFGADSREGIIVNRNSGADNQDVGRWFVRGQALWDITPEASLRVIADYSEVDNNGNTAVRARHQGARATTINIIETNEGRSLTAAGYQDSNSLSLDPWNEAEDQGVSAELNWDITPNITVTNIIAYREYYRENEGDVDFTGADVLNAFGTEGYETISNEFRITGETGALQWMAGAYWSDESIDAFTRLEFGENSGNYFCGLFTANTVAACFNATGLQPANIPTSFVGDANFNPNNVIAGEGSEGIFGTESESWSVFAQGTYQFTEQLSATLGVRYIDDHKEGFGDNTVDNTNALTDNNSLPTFLGLVNDYVAIVDTTATTGTFNVQYEWTPDLMTYFSASRGYKAGGINLDRTAATTITGQTHAPPPGNPTFRPELSDSYEIGLKSQWMDGRLGLNLTGFHTEFEDLQILSFTGLAFIVENIPEAQTRGVELEGYVRPTENLTLSTGITFAESRYGAGAQLSQAFPAPPFNLEGRNFTNAPVWSGTIGLDYRAPLSSDLTGVFHTDYFYGSGRSTSSVQLADKYQEGYGLLNLRFGLEHSSGWDLSLWCRNCSDEFYYTVMFNSVFQNSATSPNVEGYIGNRREMGLSLSVDF